MTWKDVELIKLLETTLKSLTHNGTQKQKVLHHSWFCTPNERLIINTIVNSLS